MYIALDRINGRLQGREGSFVVHHRGVISAGGATTDGAIVPGSGSGELRGLRGEASIAVDEDGTHQL